jgi:predicted NAD/FAD-dependent oxidoreductase
MGKLCEGFAAGIPVTTGSAVRSVEKNGAGYQVRHERGRVRARTVIVALPANRILELDMELLPEDREVLAAVNYAPAVRLMLRYAANDAPRVPHLTPSGPGRHAVQQVSLLNYWEAGRVPSGGEVLWISAAGWRSRQLLDQPSTEIVAALTADCEELGVQVPQPQWAEVIISRQGMVIPAPGHFRRAVEFMARQRKGLFFAGDWLSGSTVEGAVRSGLKAAQAALNQLQNGTVV